MSGSLETVEREVLALQGLLMGALQEMRQLYDAYLEVLAPIARQQLITVSYQVCTQVFPEQFLTLEEGDRQRLQQQIHRLALQLEAAILRLQPRRQESEPVPTDDPLAAEEPEATDSNGEQEENDPATEENDSLQEKLSKTLYRCSLKINHLLQRAAILPPAPIGVILEIASKAENPPLGRIPHLLTMMMDEQKSEEQGEANASPLSHQPMAAIYLQLEELEFQHPPLANHRSQIRQLESRLASLQQQLHKKQRQYLVLKASRAWWQTWKANEASQEQVASD
ncbi:hypothetical protein RYO59_002613 [Thermosynechococcaceae cyanobacterium Okahandja]